VLGFREYPRPSRSPSQSTTDLHGDVPTGKLAYSSSLGISSSHSNPFIDNTGPLPLLYPENSESGAGQDKVNASLLQDSEFDGLGEQQLRVWVAPDLSNPEFLLLLSLFPSSISRREVPLFKPPKGKSRVQDLESGFVTEEKAEISCGSGSMWIGETERSTSSMKGGLWDRFVSWWRKIFCF
jgi:hypothetical protein